MNGFRTIAWFALASATLTFAREDDAFLQAVRNDDAAAVTRLVEKDPKLATKPYEHWGPIHEAANGRGAALAVLLAHGFDANTRTEPGLTPLSIAARAGRLDNVRLLLKSGADPKARTRDGETLLHRAIPGGAEMVRLFLDLGVDVNQADARLSTPLHEADKPEVIALLLSAGADVHAKEVNWGATPFHRAAERGVEQVQEFLRHGADVQAQDERGRTPIF